MKGLAVIGGHKTGTTTLCNILNPNHAVASRPHISPTHSEFEKYPEKSVTVSTMNEGISYEVYEFFLSGDDYSSLIEDVSVKKYTILEKAINLYLDKISVFVYVINVSHKNRSEIDLYDFLKNFNKPVLLVANMIDLLSLDYALDSECDYQSYVELIKSTFELSLKSNFTSAPIFFTSCKFMIGITELTQAISDYICTDDFEKLLWSVNTNTNRELVVSSLNLTDFSSNEKKEKLSKFMNFYNQRFSRNKKMDNNNFATSETSGNYKLKKLQLYKCSIDDPTITTLVEEMIGNEGLNKLEELDLRENNISYTGARRLAETKHPTLKQINLTDNRISCSIELFEILTKKFAKNNSLQKIVIGQNFLDKDCKPLFQKGKEESPYRYRFYETQPNVVSSLLDSKREITTKDWLISLACKKGTEHSMLYMEGMRKNGQRFLERYHITAEGIIGIATVIIEDPTLKFFKSQDYYLLVMSISKTDGNILRSKIVDDSKQQINFCKLYPSSSKKRVNCLKWCKQKLAEVDIHVDASSFDLPSRAAGGSLFDKCLFM